MFGGLKTHLCMKCNKEISVNNFKRHEKSCNGLKVKQIRGIDFDPNIGFKNGNRKQWNTGLTKETDPRVAKYAKSLRNSDKNIGRCKDPIKEKYRRVKLSVAARKQGFGGYNAKSGRSKKYNILDSFGNIVCLQSSYEYRTAIILNEQNIKWLRPKYLKYSENRKYFPDFYLPEFNVYLDPKNDYKIKLDIDKINAVIKENNVDLRIVSNDDIELMRASVAEWLGTQLIIVTM